MTVFKHLSAFAAFWLLSYGLSVLLFLYLQSEYVSNTFEAQFTFAMMMFIYCGVAYFHTMDKSMVAGQLWRYRVIRLIAYSLLVPLVVMLITYLESIHIKRATGYDVPLLCACYAITDGIFNLVYAKPKHPLSHNAEHTK